MNLNLSDTFNNELPADSITTNLPRRQVINACFSYCTLRSPSNPLVIHAAKDVANFLNINQNDIEQNEFLEVFSGLKTYADTRPYAMCYGGHQFGNWAGQLGDGRAINLFEVNHKNKQWVLQLKGAGETPYSRTADGLAVLRSSIREYLCAEAMNALGVPTTRSLSIILSGDEVLRDVLYNGNPAYEKGAIVCRVSPSFIRFGNFEILTSRDDVTNLKALADYTLKYFFTNLDTNSSTRYIDFFREISEKTRKMVLEWQRVGFVHGVMNTDNMSILGLTIDYGPYGWLEGYDPDWTPNTTDRQHKRYRFGNQPNIALWNLVQLANALYPLINDVKPLEEIIENYKTQFAKEYLVMMKQKLGLFEENLADQDLVFQLEETLKLTETDMTIFFRNLGNFVKEKTEDELNQKLSIINDSFYELGEVKDEIKDAWFSWIIQYTNRLRQESKTDNERKVLMDSVNPKYVLRNYIAQIAIDEAEKGNYQVISELYELLQKPYKEQPQYQNWFAKRPDWARNKVGCSMLSCSS